MHNLHWSTKRERETKESGELFLIPPTALDSLSQTHTLFPRNCLFSPPPTLITLYMREFEMLLFIFFLQIKLEIVIPPRVGTPDLLGRSRDSSRILPWREYRPRL